MAVLQSAQHLPVREHVLVDVVSLVNAAVETMVAEVITRLNLFAGCTIAMKCILH